MDEVAHIRPEVWCATDVQHLLWDMSAEHVGTPAAPGVAAGLQSPAPGGTVAVGSTFMVRGKEWTVMRAAKSAEVLNDDPHTYMCKPQGGRQYKPYVGSFIRRQQQTGDGGGSGGSSPGFRSPHRRRVSRGSGLDLDAMAEQINRACEAEEAGGGSADESEAGQSVIYK